jgi:P27 family predicted phage terminase small subunit
MGKRGPHAMADNVRQLRGTHPERSDERREVKKVKLTPSRPNPPTGLDREAAAEWRRIVPELDDKGLLSKVDRGVLTAYCRAWSHACAAQKILEEGDLVLPGTEDYGPRKHPAWQIWREATTLATALQKELLLTPSARLRATMPEAADGKNGSDDIFD